MVVTQAFISTDPDVLHVHRLTKNLTVRRLVTERILPGLESQELYDDVDQPE